MWLIGSLLSGKPLTVYLRPNNAASVDKSRPEDAGDCNRSAHRAGDRHMWRSFRWPALLPVRSMEGDFGDEIA